MDFSEKLRGLRADAGLSQEELAEKVNVSRQAVTKWETGRGIPDIANVVALARLFGVSTDELLRGQADDAGTELNTGVRRHVYESVTEYDIDGGKFFDLRLGGAERLRIAGTDGEKVRVVLSSDVLAGLEKDFKVKIDDIKGRIDIEIHRAKAVTEAEAKDALTLTVLLPKKYLLRMEADCNCRSLFMESLCCNSIEFNGRAETCGLDGVSGTVELNCNLDMELKASGFEGRLEVNQLNATSRLFVPKDFCFRTVTKGIANRITFRARGSLADDFSEADAENVVELNGMKSELMIERLS